MKKKTIASLLTAIVLAFSACNPANGGGGGDPTGTGAIPKNPPTETKVFTLPSTYKITLEEDTSAYYQKGKKLQFALAKNEYESAQLFLRPHKDVGSFHLETADLTGDNGATLSKELFEVYAQWYIRTNITSIDSNHPLGYYPDALVPIEEYRACGYDDVEAGCNQGITVTLKTETATAAGVYMGNFKLTYDGVMETVPVEVTVWDFAVPEENHVVSALGNPFYEELIGGALDNTPEMYEAYNEFFLDRRINVNNLVSPQLSDAQQMEKLRAYSIDSRVTAYSYLQEGDKPQEIERKLRLLIENSDPTHNLLKKNFIYAWDEPYGREERASELGKEIVDLLIRLADEYASDLADYGLTREDILSQDILMPFTLTANSTEVKGLRTYCPLISDFKEKSLRDRYARLREEAYAGANNELAENNYASTWWYTANMTGGSGNTPTQALDAELYPLRACSWMQYEYGVKGYLNWGAFVYLDTATIGKEVWGSSDVYNDPANTIHNMNGDGYLVYPGLKFGIDGPIPSLRMNTLTDGFEDYEYLYVFNALAQEYAEKYGGVAYEKLLTSLYRSIYDNVSANGNPEAVLNARKTLASYIELLESDLHGMVFVEGVDIATGSANVSIYGEAGTTFLYNGQTYMGTPCGEGVKISITCSLAQSSYLSGVLKNGDETFAIENVFLSEKVQGISTCNTLDEIAKFSVTQRITTEYTDESGNLVPIPKDHITLALDGSLGENVMKVTFGACVHSNAGEAKYQPAIILSKADAFGNRSLDDVKTVNVRIYNPSEEDVTVTFQLRAGSKMKNFATATLATGWNDVSVPNVNELDWAYKDQVTQFRICINRNVTSDVVLYFGEMYYTYSGV